MRSAAASVGPCAPSGGDGVGTFTYAEAGLGLAQPISAAVAAGDG